MAKKLAIVRTLTDKEMDIIQDALENWLEDYYEDDSQDPDVVAAYKLYKELRDED